MRDRETEKHENRETEREKERERGEREREEREREREERREREMEGKPELDKYQKTFYVPSRFPFLYFISCLAILTNTSTPHKF